MSRLSGIFAFALWDRPARRLVLARDRFGVKPLYYRIEPDRLIFASEVKAILAATPCTPRVCPRPTILTLQNVRFVDLTLFVGCHPAPMHRSGREDGAVETRAYWTWRRAPRIAAAPRPVRARRSRPPSSVSS